VTAEEIKETLFSAARVKFPSIDKDSTLSAQVEQVQDYLIITAQRHADLLEARLHAQFALDLLEDEWEMLPRPDWEDFLLNPSHPTNKMIEMAKSNVRPDIYGAMRELRRLSSRIAEQINRFELDDKRASRTYTMLTGG
jgi:hypothetical protein